MLVTLLAVPSLVCNLQERANDDGDDDDDSVAEITESTDTDEAAKAGGCLWPNVRLSIHSCWCRIHPIHSLSVLRFGHCKIGEILNDLNDSMENNI